LELSVVLVIVSMLMALLFQMTTQMQRLEARQAERRSEFARSAMERDWLRGVLTSFAYDFPGVVNPARRFAGTATEMRGFTMGAITYAPGAPRDVRLRIVNREGVAFVEYAERGGTGYERPIYLAQSALALTFEYVDRDGTVHAAWPRPEGDQLPALIRITARSPDAVPKTVLSAHPLGTEVPRRDMVGQ
jgi:hypothetical protein